MRSLLEEFGVVGVERAALYSTPLDELGLSDFDQVEFASCLAVSCGLAQIPELPDRVVTVGAVVRALLSSGLDDSTL